MGKYVYIYYSGANSDAGNDADWGNWFGTLGDKLVDGGNPFKEGGQAVHGGGTMDIQGPPATGYSIVSAASFEEATEMAKGCPLMKSTDGAVCVYEALPM